MQTTASDIVITLQVMRLGINQCGAAGSAADNAAEPVLSVRAWAAVIAQAGFNISHALLHGIPKIFVDDRLVLAANGKSIRVIKVTAALSLWVPSEHTDINRIAEDIFYCSILEGCAAMGGNALRIQPFCDCEQSFSGCKAFENLANERGFDFVRIELLIF